MHNFALAQNSIALTKDKVIRKNVLKQEKLENSRKKPKKAPGNNSGGVNIFKSEKLHSTVGAFLILLSLFALISSVSYLINYFSLRPDYRLTNTGVYELLIDPSITVNNWGGRLGGLLSNQLIKEGFGIGAFFLQFFLFILGVRLVLNKINFSLWRTLILCSVISVWLSLTMGFFFSKGDYSVLGGIFGVYGYQWLEGFMGRIGAGMLLIFILIVLLVFTVNLSLKALIPVRKEKPLPDNIVTDPWMRPQGKNNLKEDKYNTNEFVVDDVDNTWELTTPPFKQNDQKNDDFLETPFGNPPIGNEASNEIELTIEQPAKVLFDETNGTNNHVTHYTTDTPYDPTLDLASYIIPSIDLLEDFAEQVIKVNREEHEENKNRIVQTLGNYGIRIEKIKATVGPAVTLYEIIPAPGVRISKIKNLEDDIALSLSAMGIRIIAPIPGKGTIGIEVPNQNPENVSMKSIITSERFQSGKYDLPFGMGKTISNESFVADLTKMPHILMAGATGQGKSVGLNAIITSLLYKKHPAQVKFVMIDPKKVELTLYSKIERHFLAKLPDSDEAIITDTRKVVRTLNSLNIEMDTRYDLLKDAQVRNIKEYNNKFIARQLNPLQGHHFLPYIIVVIDEFADLIMTAGKEIEVPLTRLAQLARATGIHLIIATQRPSVNIITGSIKANFPARFAFRVISKIDSRTILDSSGAEQLIGRGDMLLSTGNDLIRLQCAFIDTHEIERITDFIGSQRGYPDAFYLPEYNDEESEAGELFDPSEHDEFFEDAARIIVAHQQGSTSLLQRKLKLGYNRAGRIIDQLEKAGIVGPFEGSKAREVRIANEFALEQFLRDMHLK